MDRTPGRYRNFRRGAACCGPPVSRRPARVTLKGAEVQLIRLCRQFAASGECNELRRVAVRRVGWRRTARLYEPQKLSQQFNPKQSPPHSPMLGLARRENRNRFSRPKNSHSPKHSPILRPVCASLRLRFRSAAFFARLRDSSIFGSHRNS